MYCVAASIVIVSGVERLVRQCNQQIQSSLLITVYHDPYKNKTINKVVRKERLH